MNCIFLLAVMGVVSVIVVVYRWTLYPALLFLIYIAVQLFKGASRGDSVAPLLIGSGLLLMHYGNALRTAAAADDSSSPSRYPWMIFWLGESLVIFMFSFNSVSTRSSVALGAMGVGSILAALWFRGSLWNYATALGLELLAAIVVAFTSPLVELLLEAILNDKMRKVGEKVRAHHAEVQRHYEAKLKGRQ